MSNIVGIDTGGTWTRIWNGKDAVMREPTPYDYAPYLDLLVGQLEKLTPEFMAVALPAVIENNRVVKAPNLSDDWKGKHIIADIRDRLSTSLPEPPKILLVQDTEAAGYAIQRSMLNGKSPALFVTLSTGVGAALVRGNDILPMEAGHLPLNLSGCNSICSCGRIGCAEADLSGTAISRRTQKSAENLDEGDLFWKQYYGKEVGQFLLGLTILFRPKQIIIGGGVAQRLSAFLPTTQEYLKEQLKDIPVPEMRMLDGDAGVKGAYWLAEAMSIKAAAEPSAMG